MEYHFSKSNFSLKNLLNQQQKQIKKIKKIHNVEVYDKVQPRLMLVKKKADKQNKYSCIIYA